MRHVWVVECYWKGKWIVWVATEEDRKNAREWARELRAEGREVRVRKYIPEVK